MLRAPGRQLLAAAALITVGLTCVVLAGGIAYTALDKGGPQATVTALPVIVEHTPSPRPQPPKRTRAPTPSATPEPTPVPFAGALTTALFDQKLGACGAYPNGSAHRVRETGRFFFSLPQALFPDIAGFEFLTASGDAKAGWISNAGRFGHAFEARPGCWKYYFEFVGDGETVLTAQSPVDGAPVYAVHFMVESADVWPTGTYGPIN